MAIEKRVLCPERVRRVPSAFSWIDHRLVREGHISRLSHEAQALYLFLVTVADAEGLSYYSEAKAAGLLNMDAGMLRSSRRELCRVGLIAHRHPLYQVLCLDHPEAGLFSTPPARPRCSGGEAVSIGEILREAIGGAQ
jgi:hypothetical protein